MIKSFWCDEMSNLSRLFFIIGTVGYIGGAGSCEYFISRRSGTEIVSRLEAIKNRQNDLDYLLTQPASKLEEECLINQKNNLHMEYCSIMNSKEAKDYSKDTKYAKYGITIALISMLPFLYGSIRHFEER